MWPIFLPALLLHAPLTAAAAIENRSPYVPQVSTRNGIIHGLHSSVYQQDFFLGIPFAQPPVGDLRFSRPKPFNTTWETPLRATSYGPSCHGNSLGLIGFSQPTITYPEDEDCLSLNIVRPSNSSQSSRLPVLVWIHGGGFQEGSSREARYNMSHVVEASVDMGQPIIGVSINYRLGPFGFISGQPFRESQGTNLGLHDQRMALRWVQENIQAFGGDASRVTVQGESAGALSIGLHLIANNGSDEGLFHRVISQSGGPFYHLSLASDKTQDSMLASLANATRCSRHDDLLSCLRTVPAIELRNASSSISWNPIIDDDLISGLPSRALSRGEFIRVPMLIGANTNEGTSFVPVLSPTIPRTAKDFSNAVLAFHGGGVSAETLSRFQDLYLNQDKVVQQRDLGTVLSSPGEPYGLIHGPMSLVAGDLVIIAGRRIAAEAWAKFGVDAYSYRFDTVPTEVSPQILGAAHFQEIPFVFRNIEGQGHEYSAFATPNSDLSRQYIGLSDLMVRMWISFANSGSPNNHGVKSFSSVWPKYDSTEPRNIVFNAERGSWVEADTFRGEAIRLIHDTASSMNR